MLSAPGTPWSLDASTDLPAGPTADAFNQYVAVDADIPTAAESADAELLALRRISQSADDVSGDEFR